MPTIDYSQVSRIRTAALYFAGPLSRIVTHPIIYRKLGTLAVYSNFLIGKGAGTGWNMKEEIRASTALIHRPKPVILDVGANKGKWSEALLAKCPGARIIMCEPNPTSQAEIRKLGLPNTTLVPRAVGEKEEEATLFSSQDCDGSASLHVHVDSFFSSREYRSIPVQIDTIDHIAEVHGLDFIDFVKMDIEGHELFALRGAQKCLANHNIGGLLFEFGFGNLNSRTFLKDFWDLLSNDFNLYRVTPGGTPLLIESYYEDLEYFRGATNYIAALKNHPFRKSGANGG